jgi:peptide/nickel transport system substrate-binding protein
MRKYLLLCLSIVIIASMVLSACSAPAAPVGEQPAAQQPAAQEQAAEQPAAEKPAAEPEKPAAPAPAAEEPVEPPSKFQQSPFLDGKGLPPVEERLPENPMVIKPLAGTDQKYGGNLRIGFTGGSPSWGGMFYVTAWEGLVQWAPDFASVEPALLEKLEANDEATEYTLHIRKGLKWSDGYPYTADDIMFYIEDFGMNKELSPGGLSTDWLPSDMKDGFKAEKIDDYTVKFIFPAPYGTFPFVLAAWGGRYFDAFPKHYLVQFHADYNDKVDELVAKEEGVEDWVGLFYKLGPDSWANPDRKFERPEIPVMGPWVTTQPLGTGSTVLLERNPYYWKVDPNGNQLPYIDQITGRKFEDEQTRTLAMLNGELDHIAGASIEDRPLYHDARDQGKPLQIKYPRETTATTANVHFNWTIEDPVKAEIFSNKDFRIGMSHAIDRWELIEIVYNGQGEPAQASPFEDSPLYNERMTKQYTEYDVDLANAHLDKIIPNRGADGYRLGTDGKPLQIVLFVPNDISWATTYEQLGELLVGYWDAVGVKVLMNSMPSQQVTDNKEQNLLEANIFASGDAAGISPLLSQRDYVPMDYHSYSSNGWYYWRVQEPDMVWVEAPQWAQDKYSKYVNDVLGGATLEDQIAAMKVLIEDATERFYSIGIARPGPNYLPFHARLGGIPDSWFAGWTPGNAKIYRPEQWYLTD